MLLTGSQISPQTLKRLQRLREEVIKLDKNIQAVKFAIEEKYPGYFNVKYGYQPVPLADVQKMMSSEKTGFAGVFLGE